MAVQKIVATSKVKHDKLYRILSRSDILAHKSCYCSYTAMSKNNKEGTRKSTLTTTAISKRLLKSHCSDFVLKRDCLLCGNECKPKDSKNPHRWVQVRQCASINRVSDITFKQHLEHICDERQDQLANEVAAQLSGVIDLPAADEQHHIPCYNNVRVVPVSRPSMMAPEVEAMGSVSRR